MITNFSEGQFLKASDIPKPVIGIITELRMETLGQDLKYVLAFSNLGKPLVLNKTNGRVLEDLFSNESDNWAGKPIELFACQTNFKGDMVPCIRLRPAAVKTAATVQPENITITTETPF